MKISNLTKNEISNTFKPLTFSLNESTTPIDDKKMPTRAGLRRLHTETIQPRTLERNWKEFRALYEKIESAWSDDNYKKCITIIEKLNKLCKDLNIGFNFKSAEAYCLYLLGKLDKAYACYTEHLTELSPSEDWDNEFKKIVKEAELKKFKENRSRFPNFSTISYEKLIDQDLENILVYFEKFFGGRELCELQKIGKVNGLVDRGFIALRLGKKELGFADFKEAAILNSNYGYLEVNDPEFFLRCLERGLKTTFMPIKDHEKIVEELSKKIVLSNAEAYQLLMSYALIGKEKEALELYEIMVKTKDFDYPEETEFFLAWLRNDLETAKAELEGAEGMDRDKLIFLINL